MSKDKYWKLRKKRENARYLYARNHWKQFDTVVLEQKLADIRFMDYDVISSMALEDEINSRREK